MQYKSFKQNTTDTTGNISANPIPSVYCKYYVQESWRSQKLQASMYNRTIDVYRNIYAYAFKF